VVEKEPNDLPVQQIVSGECLRSKGRELKMVLLKRPHIRRFMQSRPCHKSENCLYMHLVSSTLPNTRGLCRVCAFAVSASVSEAEVAKVLLEACPSSVQRARVRGCESGCDKLHTQSVAAPSYWGITRALGWCRWVGITVHKSEFAQIPYLQHIYAISVSCKPGDSERVAYGVQ
jgi:hypothetical protein